MNDHFRWARLWKVFPLLLVAGTIHVNLSVVRVTEPQHGVIDYRRSNLMKSAKKISMTSPVPQRSENRIPTWMKEYFEWHSDQRNKLDAGNAVPVLVVRCLKGDRCGGTADRMQPLVIYILIASKLKRLLLFYWERPCRLEEFLIPPVGGMDWRIPPAILSENDLSDHSNRLRYQDLKALMNEPIDKSSSVAQRVRLPRMATLLFQSNSREALWYDKIKSTRDTHSYPQVYRGAWESCFIPSPPVRSALESSKAILQLSEDYVAVHIRAMYQKGFGERRTRFTAENSVTCASRLLDNIGQHIFIAGDSSNSTELALDFVRRQHPNLRAVRRNDTNVIHLDRGSNFLGRHANEWTSHSPREHYSTFVDLYLLAGASCIAYNVGNFAKWANLLSEKPSCELNHGKHTCRWKDPKV